MWNYARDHWKDQYVLSPDLTVAKVRGSRI